MPYTAVVRLAQCLAAPLGGDRAAPLQEAILRLVLGGARPFEVIAGAPFLRYGPRVTFACGRADVGDPAHPWGRPDWLGLRLGPGGSMRLKPYHRRPGKDVPPHPKGLPDGLQCVMASRDGRATEVYLRQSLAQSWHDFAAACTSVVDRKAPQALLALDLTPRPSAGAFGVGLRWDDDALSAVTVYARARALPPDDEIRGAWSAALDPADRSAYELALAAVRSLGPRPFGGWHSLLAYTFETGGGTHQAASLRVPESICS